jgi:hypothetical protein
MNAERVKPPSGKDDTESKKLVRISTRQQESNNPEASRDDDSTPRLWFL